MNNEIKKLWVDALRSGVYPQTRRNLRNDTGFCVLGVLCDLYSVTTNKGAWVNLGVDGGYSFVVDGDEATTFNGKLYIGRTLVPPVVVREWAGVKDELDLTAFSYRNDNPDNPLTFEQLAQLIDEKL